MDLNCPGRIIKPNSQSSDFAIFTDNPEDGIYKKRILCEGDSWFAIGSIPGTNLLEKLTFKEITALYNLAKSGDRIVRMSDISRNPDLENVLCKKHFARRWDMLLMSGGGNDLVSRSGRIFRETPINMGVDPVDYINQAELDLLRVDIHLGYQKIAQLRDAPDSLSKGVPILIHTYDYVTPRNAGGKMFGVKVLKPWIYPDLVAYHIPQSLWIPLTRYLFDWMENVFQELPALISNFHVVKTTRTLEPASLDATGSDHDWVNEMHPNSQGCIKLAKVISPAIAKLLYP